MRLRQHSACILWRKAPFSLILFTCALTTMLLCQAVAVGLVGLVLPWIVAVTALPWVPNPGQVADVAAGFALLAVACAPLERYHRSRRVSHLTYTQHSEFHSAARAATRRGTWLVAAAIAVGAVAATGGALAVVAAGSARTQQAIVLAALRTQRRGETALAFEALAPAVSGPYDPRKSRIYFLVSGWAFDLHDWPLVAQLSIDLMRAAAADQQPRSVVTGFSQYELATQRAISSALVTTVIMSAPAGDWRVALQLLLRVPGSGASSQLETALTSAGRRLTPSVRTRFVDAASLLQGDISAGIVYR